MLSCLLFCIVRCRGRRECLVNEKRMVGNLAPHELALGNLLRYMQFWVTDIINVLKGGFEHQKPTISVYLSHFQTVWNQCIQTYRSFFHLVLYLLYLSNHLWYLLWSVMFTTRRVILKEAILTRLHVGVMGCANSRSLARISECNCV
ncbi:hypothetical protein BDZ91DRAFT_354344 [Kalaharituber pfeilii]|nr:hypothetical protein BDZ91DRAFT_354344 [Kalaharituber pfeilii]